MTIVSKDYETCESVIGKMTSKVAEVKFKMAEFAVFSTL